MLVNFTPRSRLYLYLLISVSVYRAESGEKNKMKARQKIFKGSSKIVLFLSSQYLLRSSGSSATLAMSNFYSIFVRDIPETDA